MKINLKHLAIIGLLILIYSNQALSQIIIKEDFKLSSDFPDTAKISLNKDGLLFSLDGGSFGHRTDLLVAFENGENSKV